MSISAPQIRAGRALLGWTQAKLALVAGLSEISIKKIERGVTDARGSTLSAIERALHNNGVELLNGGQPGARFRKLENGDRVTFRKGTNLKLSFGISVEQVGEVVRGYDKPPYGWRVDVVFDGKKLID